jgi:cell division ATPase FtsA
MRDTTITSIDVGSAHIRVLVADYSPNRETFIIRTLTKTDSDGLKNGYIINADSAGESIRNAIYEAEKTSGTRIRKALVSIGGIGIGTISDVATIAISRADSMVSEFDMDRLLAKSPILASSTQSPLNVSSTARRCSVSHLGTQAIV